jgi:hypothetical protein
MIELYRFTNFLTLFLGWEFPSVRLLADQHAKAGFFTHIPDLHQGDSLPYRIPTGSRSTTFSARNLGVLQKATETAKVGDTFGPWLIKHREFVSKPLMDGFIQHIHFTPTTDKEGEIVSCWGGQYAFVVAHDEVIDKGVDAT